MTMHTFYCTILLSLHAPTPIHVYLKLASKCAEIDRISNQTYIFFCSQPDLIPGVEIARRVKERYWLQERAKRSCPTQRDRRRLRFALADLRARCALGRAESESEDGWDEPGPSETEARRVDARLANAEALIGRNNDIFSRLPLERPIPPGPVVGVRQPNLINRLKIAILIGLIIVLSWRFLRFFISNYENNERALFSRASQSPL